MELALSLGDTPKGFTFLDHKVEKMSSKDLGFCMALGKESEGDQSRKLEEVTSMRCNEDDEKRGSSDPPVQLDLLPFSPVPRNHTSSQLRFPWLSENVAAKPGSNSGPVKGLELNRRHSRVEEAEDGAAASSPNSAVSSFQMDFSICRSGRSGKRDFEAAIMSNESEVDRGGASSRASDEEENGGARKKLRLTKEQSAFLEESFKEHSTLNPKQKLALAKQLNLRPRQVEVWFQNRRARTKLKQTEVDCEYLKRCCEALTEENRRLQKELQELRALKASQPFYMQLPATTLTMCPSCERVVSTTTSTAAAGKTSTTAAATTNAANTGLSLSKPSLFPYSPVEFQAPQAAS